MWVGAVVALVVGFSVPSVAAAGAPPDRRESAADVLQTLRAADLRAPRPRPAATAPERVYVVVSALTPERRAALEAAGLVIEVPARGAAASRWPGGEVVQGVASPAAARAIEALPFVRSLERPGRRWTNVGAVTTAGDTVLFGPEARALLGTDGTGVTIGVISDGADGRDASIVSGDLPADLELPAIAGVGPPKGNEGTAMLEIVHDLAPGAHLLFTGPRTSVEMLAAIDGLAAAGAHVIVDDLVFTDEPKFEDGPIARAARSFVANGGVYVTAAGNFARTHYIATYRRAKGRDIGGTAYQGVHQFAPKDVGNSLVIPPGAEVIAVLQWNEQFGQAADDFDLVLLQAGPDKQVLAASATVQDETRDPFEGLVFTNDTGSPIEAALVFAEFARPSKQNPRFNLVVFTRVDLAMQYVGAQESVFGHAAVEEVLSVAAADALAPDVLRDYSSHGPATVFFPARGVRQVPRLTAVDGVETAVGRRGGFANPFRGTSAAAPHVAGCAALLRAVGVSPSAVAVALGATTFDLGDVGFDSMFGAGRVDCASAARLATGQGSPPVLGPPAAFFGDDGALVVRAGGSDPDGDVRLATARLLDAGGAEVESATERVAPGTPVAVDVARRGGALARVRAAAVQLTDAVGLASAVETVAIGCPGDGSLGDALCATGDLLARVSAVSGRRGRRLVRLAAAVARELSRAGERRAEGRRRAAAGALRAANRNLRKVRRRARKVSLPIDEERALLDQLQVLGASLRALKRQLR